MPEDTSFARQPVSVLYGGAHLFRGDTIGKMGIIAARQLLDVAPDCYAFAAAMGMPEAADIPRTENGKMSLLRRFRKRGAVARKVHPSAWHAFSVYERVLDKLRNEAVEDYRIDFEDGYGIRSDKDEDVDADRCAVATAEAMAGDGLSPFFGIRVKPVSDEFRERAFRTLDLYLRRLLDLTSGRLPQNWVVTLPKVSSVDHVERLVKKLEQSEQTYGLEPGVLRIELMLEDPRALLADGNGTRMSSMIQAGEGRVRGVHLGLYDFLSSLGVISSMQKFQHPSADYLRSTATVIASAHGVWLSDGAVNRIPVAPVRKKQLTAAQKRKNHTSIREAWRDVHDQVLHSLTFGCYQGWDLHPSQLIPRYAAVFSVFLRDYEEARNRLRVFTDSSAQARVDGQEFDDIATGLGLLQFFARGYACGAFSKEDVERTGVSISDILSGSFSRILNPTE